MATQTRIILYAKDDLTAAQIAKIAFARISHLDSVYSDYRNDSDLTRFCEESGSGYRQVDPDLFRILDLSIVWGRRTDGIFDITAAPVIQLWRRTRRTHQLPDPTRLSAARALTGIGHLHVDRETGRAALDLPGMRLDLGGIAKGYAADQALSLIRGAGIDRALVALGGDIVVGEPPPENPIGWPIGIAPLDSPDQPPTAFILLRNGAVSTSGDSVQSVVIDGRRYSHIVDPRTGLGLTGHSSTTVVAREGVTADLLATTLSILGPAAGLRLLDRLSPVDPTLAALFVGEEHRTESPGWRRLLKR